MNATLRILVLSDTPAKRRSLERVFQKARHPATLIQASTYERYARSLEQTAFDAILAIDPFNGLDLKTAIPIARIVAPATPFIVISAAPDVRNAVSWMKAGAYEYLLEEDLARLPDLITDFQNSQSDMTVPKQESGSVLDFLRLVLDHIPIQIAVFDVVGCYLYVNTQAVRSVEMRDWLTGKTDFDFCRRRNIPMSLAEKRTEAIKECVSEKKVVAFEEFFPTAQGSHRYVTRFISPALNAEGSVVYVLGTGIDITERRHLETQLQYAQKLESLGVLAGGIAHDFNNLLTVILGHAELIKAQAGQESRYLENLRAIIQSSHRAASLCSQMLAYAGKSRLAIKPCHINTLINEIKDLLTASVSKHVRLRYQLASNLPHVLGDARQLQQILMNFVMNASEAMDPNEGTATISTGVMACSAEYLRGSFVDDQLAEGSYVYIQVEDTGVGMDEATRQMLFDPFFTTKFTGRGLGLASVLGIVRSHRGAIKIDSHPGEGTTMRVLFPATDTPATEPQTAPVNQVERWAGGHGLALIVDDEEAVRVMSQVMLERMGFSVLTAADGVEAVELFGSRSDEITFVLLDITMPRLNGEDVFWELRKIREDVPILLLSGYGEQILSRHLLADGNASFIQKPCGMSELTDKIRMLVKQ